MKNLRLFYKIILKVTNTHIKTCFILNAVNKITKGNKSIFFLKTRFCVIYGSLTGIHI